MRGHAGPKTPRKHDHASVEHGIRRACAGAGSGRSGAFTVPSISPLSKSVISQSSTKALHSFSRFLSRDQISRHLADGHLLHPTEAFEVDLKGAINDLSSQGKGKEVLGCLKDLLKTLYPRGKHLTVHERQRLAEQRIKTIYVHAHMDEDIYDVSRAMRCPEQVPVPAEKLVPACNYNLFYGMKDQRFRGH